MQERVLTFADALALTLEHAAIAAGDITRTVETVPLEHAAGRTLAVAVVADRDQPPFARSTRDGYALRAADAGGTLRVTGSLRAGEMWTGPALGAGEAIEIMTGAPLPAGADAVVMVEHVVTGENGTLQLAEGRSLRAGENVVPQGAEALAGASVLRAGTSIRAAEIAVAASCGLAKLPVFRKPRVAIVATGDELVELDEPMEKWQIRNSNSYALAALVRASGGEPAVLPVARDTREDIRARIAEGSNADLLVLSGGVSMGKYDLVEEVLAEFGAEIFFTGALIQPGKPAVFGRLRKNSEDSESASPQVRKSAEWVYFFGLPGNPVSTQVTFALFVAPLLRALAGHAVSGPQFTEARLAEDVPGGTRVTRFLPAELDSHWDGVVVRVVGWQGSGDVAANARGNAYCVLPAGVAAFKAGDSVRVLLR